MMSEPHFLSISEIIKIHDQEIAAAGGLSGVRDINALEWSIPDEDI
jgi:prophage maintenance system killer protein